MHFERGLRGLGDLSVGDNGMGGRGLHIFKLGWPDDKYPGKECRRRQVQGIRKRNSCPVSVWCSSSPRP